LLAAHPEVNVILCDDGLQHYRLARDVELAVFDGRGAGNGWRLPLGPLREPLSRLAAVDAVICNGLPDSRIPPSTPQFAMCLQAADFYRLDELGSRVLPLTSRGASSTPWPALAIPGDSSGRWKGWGCLLQRIHFRITMLMPLLIWLSPKMASC
jgi:hypothetical protein